MRLIQSLLTLSVAGACLTMGLTGCVKPPDQEVVAAKKAVQAARNAEADKYLANNFINLEKALEAAESEVELQKQKFVMSQNYTRSKQLLKNVTDRGNQLAADAPAAKEEMRKQVEEGLVSIQKMAKETRVDIRKAPKSKGKKVIEKMKTDLDAAEKAIAEASSDFSAGNVPDAGKKLAEAQGLLKRIFDKLSSSGTDGLM